MLRYLLAVLLLLLGASPALPADGKFFRSLCLSGDQAKVSMCAGYGVGIGQALIYANRWGQKVGQAALPAQFCVPDDFQPRETAAIILEYMDAHPTDEVMDLAVLGNAALADRFPCNTSALGNVQLQPGFSLQ